MGNVLAVVSDQKKEDGSAQILNITDYYPFGMEMDGRKYEKDGDYRYGFNGQEKMPELDESHTTALFWEYDGRLGRRWNMDPVPVSEIGNYVVLGNNPILCMDEFGDELDVANKEASKADVQSLVSKKNRKYLSFTYIEGSKLKY